MIKGILNNKAEVENIIRHLCNKGHPLSIRFEYIPSGYTDNVFLAHARDNIYVIKEYLEDWHSREADTYYKLLNKFEIKCSPNIIYSSKKFIILEYLDPTKYRKMSAIDLPILKNWIICKHKHFLSDSVLNKYKEPIEVQYRYLVDKPLQTINKLSEGGALNITIDITKLNSSKDLFIKYINENDNLPITLEHGDLEPQNIFIGNNGGITLIDWVNTRAGSGFFDINQYFETARELDLSYKERAIDLTFFSESLNIEGFNKYLYQSRVLMLLNKLNFYGNKVLEGSTVSGSKNMSTLELFKLYYEELKSLL